MYLSSCEYRVIGFGWLVWFRCLVVGSVWDYECFLRGGMLDFRGFVVLLQIDSACRRVCGYSGLRVAIVLC